MNVIAIAAGSVLSAAMMFTALGTGAQVDVQRAVRNAVHDWEAPLPPLLRLGIDFALNEAGIPMLSRRCAPPSPASDTAFAVAVKATISAPTGSRACPKPPVKRPDGRSDTDRYRGDGAATHFTTRLIGQDL
jgi:hypothetical protein